MRSCFYFLLLILGLCVCHSSQSSDTPFSFSNLSKNAEKISHTLTNIRQHLHTIPELCFEEFKTSSYIQKVLDENNVYYTANWGKSPHHPDWPGNGIIAQIGTGKSPCVAIRADIDALPIEEMVNVPYKSTHEGKMHACGHDAHITILLGALLILKEHEDQIPGTVKFLFQPAEEGGAGALMMVNEGALEISPPIEQIFGYHLRPNYPTTHIATTPHIMSAAAESFYVNVTGRGGHGAEPHRSIDPVPAAMALGRAFLDLYAREMYFQTETAAVISISDIETAPGPFNVIPDFVCMAGTVRAPYTHTMDYIKQRFQSIANGVQTAYKCKIDVQFEENAYPPLHNTPEMYTFFKDVASKANLGYGFQEPQMSGEDFAFYAQKIPSFYVQLGSGSGIDVEGYPHTDYPLHTAYFAVDDRILPFGAAYNAYFAIEALMKA